MKRTRAAGRAKSPALVARVIRDPSSVQPALKPLMEAVRREITGPNGLFVGAVCESKPGQKSKWSGLVLATSDPTAGVPARPLVDVVYDRRTLCLLLYDENSPRDPGEKWHLRIQEDARGGKIFLSPWAQDLARLLSLEEGGKKAASYLAEGKFYGAITDRHVEKLLCLSPQAWWTRLFDSSKAQGLTPTGGAGEFLKVILAAPKELFTATFFFRGNEQERSLLGAVRRAFEAELLDAASDIDIVDSADAYGRLPVSRRPPLKNPQLQLHLHREAGASDAEVSFDIRLELGEPPRPKPADSLAAYLKGLAKSAASQPLTPREEGLLQDLLTRRLAAATGLPLPGTKTATPVPGGPPSNSPSHNPSHRVAPLPQFVLSQLAGETRRYSLDLAVVVSEDDPHLLLTLVGRPFLEDGPHDRAGRLCGSQGAHIDLEAWRREASPEMMEVARRSWGVVNALSLSDADLTRRSREDLAMALFLKTRAEEALDAGFDLGGLPRGNGALKANPSPTKYSPPAASPS